MIKYEYLTVTFESNRWGGDDGVLERRPISEVPMRASEMLSQCGEDGWELVSVRGEPGQFIFKRPKS